MAQRTSIILSSRSGTRWYPVATTFCRQLLPVHAAPVTHYSLVIVLPADAEKFP